MNLYYNNLSQAEALICSIYTADGKLVKQFSKELFKGKQITSFDISELATGDYIAVFEGNGILFETKLLKQ